MVSAELLCEIDHALCYAKENYDDWFGGINMIFSGDFYQFPPVASTPLYSPLNFSKKSNSNKLYKQLGRLTWKSLNKVVELTIQKRMKSDPKYCSAVNPLRVHLCNDSDKDLFNS